MFRCLCLTFAVVSCLMASASLALAAGELTLTIVDPATGKQMPCRMHVRNDKDRPQRAAKTLFWDDHFVFPGTVRLKLPRGTYHFEIEHGPEYLAINGYFEIREQAVGDKAKDEKTFELKRACDMAHEGWWSGDLHVHRPVKDAELLMRADDLHVAAFVTWSEKKTEWARKPPPANTVKRFDDNRYYDLVAGESVGAGGTLLFINLPKPLATAEGADGQLNLLSAAREEPAAWIDASRITAWDLPLWLATGRVDSIELCDDQFCRAATHEDPTGRPRDKSAPGPAGVGAWAHELYYHVLNCGLRIPPSAGSGSGEAANPIGYNRVYVWVDKENFSYDNWWKGFRLGRSVVTNGPLIQPFANGRQPGHVFHASEGEGVTFEVGLNVTNRETISYFELIKDGRVVQSLRYDEWVAKNGLFSPLEFDASGWFLVRAVIDNEETYRFATSAPWYVEIGGKPKRISRDSAQFFLDWLDERRQAIEGSDRPESDASKKMWADAKEYWERLVAEGEE